MKTFKLWSDVPNSFEGQCYVGQYMKEYWFKKNTILHREDGPAVICKKGRKEWLQNDMLHRLDGPAIVHDSGEEYYFIEDNPITDEEYWNHPLVIEHKLNKILKL